MAKPLGPSEFDLIAQPRNLDAEQAVLGTFFLNELSAQSVLGMLEPRHFYDPRHQEIYREIKKLLKKGEPVDPMLLINEFDRRGTLEKVGGAAYISGLEQAVISPDNVRYHAQIVLEKALLRYIIECSYKQTDAALAERDFDVLLHMLAQVIDNTNKALSASRVKTMADIAPEIYSEMVEEQESSSGGMSTGFAALDQCIGGLRPGCFLVLAGRPSWGKTAFATQITRFVTSTGRTALIFSLEMRARDLLHRIIALETGGKITMDDFHRFPWSEEMMAVVSERLDVMSREKNFGIYDECSMTPETIRAHALNFRALVGQLHLIVIDYIQLMSSPAKVDNRQVAVAEFSRQCKRLARDLHVPVIALSQLSRASTAFGGTRGQNLEVADEAMDRDALRKIKLHDLRESGAIEQDADIVLLVNHVGWRVIKNRQGRLMEGGLKFEGKYQWFCPESY